MALRTVGVRLQADVREYSASITKAGKDTKTLGDKLTEAAKSGDKTAAATADAARTVAQLAEQMKASGRAGVTGFKLSEDAARRLDDQIEETARSIQALEAEFAKTGDFKLVSSLNRQMGLLKRQLKARDLFNPAEATKAGTEMAGQVAVSFGAKLGPLIARAPMAGMNPAVAAIAGPLALGAATLVGGAIAGAVVGGAGIGGVAGGLVLAARDGRVRDAAAGVGDELSAMLGRASASFVPATIEGLDIIRARVLGMEPQLKRMFAAASRLVEPLVDGGLRGVERALPGIVRAIENAEPVIAAISDGLAQIGRAVGDVFMDLSDNATSGADALRYLFAIIEGGIRVVGAVVNGLAELWQWSAMFSSATSGDWGRLTSLVAGEMDVGNAAEDAAGDLQNLGTEALTLEERLAELKTAFDELFGAQMSIDEATIRYRQGIRDLNEELTKGARTLSLNSEEGLKNRSAVLEQIQSIADLRAARIEHGMALDEADAKYGRDIEGLRRQMIQAGFTKAEVDRLIGAYRDIPKRVDTKVAVDTTSAMQRAKALREYLKKIPDEVVNIAMRVTGQRNASAAAAAIRKQYANRWGNVYHAEDGLLRQANAWGPGDTMYAWREPATGGEAFVPKNGDAGRSLGILDTAAGWYGHAVVPRQQAQPMVAMAGGGGTLLADITIRWPDGSVAGRLVASGLRADPRGTLGALQVAVETTPGAAPALRR